MNDWLRKYLVCSRDKNELEEKNGQLICSVGHIYPIVNDIPIMLVDDAEPTHDYFKRTLDKVLSLNGAANIPTDRNGKEENEIDEFVQGEVPYTSGNLYFSVQHKLKRYPIPNILLPESKGEHLLDIGCNWGRWSIASAQKGYQVIGIDPSLEAVLAAQRVSKQIGVNPSFVVGDARFLPFKENSFDVVFSYGVFQHFSKKNTRNSLDQISYVLKKNKLVYIQMPNRFGIRQYYQHWRRGFTEGEGFEVRYWTPKELINTFEKKFGGTELLTDCYFGLGIQKSDVDLLPMHFQAVVYTSETLKNISKFIKPLVKVADSVYLISINQNKTE